MPPFFENLYYKAAAISRLSIDLACVSDRMIRIGRDISNICPTAVRQFSVFVK
jgi:hypothetical protein